MLADAKNQKKYEAISQKLEEMICENDYSVGDRIPPIAKLASHFSVNAATIFKALDQLEEKNIIERIRRKGTFVKEIPEKAKAEEASSSPLSRDLLQGSQFGSFFIDSTKTLEFIADESRNPVHNQYWERIIELAEKKMSNTRINITTVKQGKNYSASEIDLVMGLLPIARFMNNDLFLKMNMDKISKGLNFNEIFPIATNECVSNGKVAAIPFSLIPACTISNKAVDKPQTISPDFINYLFFNLDCAGIKYQENGKVNLSDKACHKLLEKCKKSYLAYLNELVEKPEIRSSQDYQSLMQLLQAGDIDKMNFFTYALTELVDSKENIDNIKLSPILGMPRNNSPVIVSALQVPADSHNKKRAIEFAQIAASEEAQSIMAEYLGNIPANIKVAQDSTTANWQINGYEDVLKSLTYESYYSNNRKFYPSFNTMNTVLKNIMSYYHGDQKLVDVLTEIEEIFN